MRALAGLILLLLSGSCSFGYSVLSHEAVIDALWDVRLRAILLMRFPNATPEQLKEAHGYAYGGAILQDMGYYPHSNGYFSDLTHYIRSADFIEALITDSQTLDEYAFALGALSHYASDNDGHRLATNVGEGLLYPKLRQKYGSVITYDQNPTAHLRTEYGFDVEEVAKGNYAPGAYHSFIGFNVSKPLLERAFRETYNFELSQMFNVDQAIGSYRHTLSTLIPFFTRVAWADHQDEIRRARPGITKKKFLYVMRRSSYEREWGKQYDRPSLFDRILAFFVRILPPIGRLKILKFKALTPHVEQLFMKSFNQTAKDYRANLNEAGTGRLHIVNTNLDVGAVSKPGEYELQDETYVYWLNQLANNKFNGVTAEVKDDILGYYRDPDLAIPRKIKKRDLQQLFFQLEELRGATVQPQNSSSTPN